MRSRWKSGATAMALAAVVAAGGLAPLISQAAPPPAAKDFSKPAVVILGYGLYPNGTMRTILRRRVLTGLAVARCFPNPPSSSPGQPAERQNGSRADAPDAAPARRSGNRIIVEDRANSTVQNAQFSVPLAKQAGTSGIILVTSTTHQGRADGDFADAGANLLATVSYPDGNPSINVAQFARDAISPFVGLG